MAECKTENAHYKCAVRLAVTLSRPRSGSWAARHAALTELAAGPGAGDVKVASLSSARGMEGMMVCGILMAIMMLMARWVLMVCSGLTIMRS